MGEIFAPNETVKIYHYDRGRLLGGVAGSLFVLGLVQGALWWAWTVMPGAGQAALAGLSLAMGALALFGLAIDIGALLLPYAVRIDSEKVSFKSVWNPLFALGSVTITIPRRADWRGVGFSAEGIGFPAPVEMIVEARGVRRMRLSRGLGVRMKMIARSPAMAVDLLALAEHGGAR